MIAITESHLIHISNEEELHTKVINFLRKFYPEAIIVSGCIDQTTDQLRIASNKKGYEAGQPDIMIVNRHPVCTGMAIELKSPTGKGKLSEKQKHFIDRLEHNLWTCIVSNNYDYIIVKIVEYFHEIRCGKTSESLFTLSDTRTGSSRDSDDEE